MRSVALESSESLVTSNTRVVMLSAVKQKQQDSREWQEIDQIVSIPDFEAPVTSRWGGPYHWFS